jgi:hypothetical protein
MRHLSDATAFAGSRTSENGVHLLISRQQRRQSLCHSCLDLLREGKNCYVTARSKNAYPMRCIDTLRRRNHLHLQTASPLWAKLRRSVASALRRSREPRTLPRGRKHLIRNLVYAESKVDRLSQDDDSSCPLRKTRSTLPLRLQCCAYAPIDSLRLGHQGTRKRDKIRNFALLKENIERS